MKTNSELKILSNILCASDKAIKKGEAYIAYSSKHIHTFNIFEEQVFLREWEASLSNLIVAIRTEKKIFQSSEPIVTVFLRLTDEKVDVPVKLKNRFNEKDNITIRNVLYIARHYEEHIDKTDDEKYALLADTIPFSKLMTIALLAYGLASSEWNSLSNEEKRIAIANGIETKRHINWAQEKIEKNYIPQLQKMKKSGETEINLKPLEDFLKFEPNSSNVVLYNPEVTREYGDYHDQL